MFLSSTNAGAAMCDETTSELQVGAADGVCVGFAKTVGGIYRQKGFAGFYNGFKVGVLKTAPMSALSFGTYELIRNRLDAPAHSSPDFQSCTTGSGASRA